MISIPYMVQKQGPTAFVIGLFWLITETVFGISSADRFAPLPVGPQHFFYFDYPVYVPASARVRKAGSFMVEFDYFHVNFLGKSVNHGVDIGSGGKSTGLDFEFKHCGHFFPGGLEGFDWNCKQQGYSILQDGETQRRGLKASIGLGARLELQLSKHETSFRGGNLDRFAEDINSKFGLSKSVREGFPRNDLGIYVWDNENLKFLYRLDQPTSGYQPESTTLGLKWGLIQGKSLSLAMRYASNQESGLIRQKNQAEGQNQNYTRFGDRLLAMDFNWAFQNWAFHLGYGQTRLGNRLFALSPNNLNFQFYALMGRLGEESEWMLQDLTYTSLFPKDGREALHLSLRERTLGARIRFGSHFSWRLGIVENMTDYPNNIDLALFSGLSLGF
ncbi:MAG: DUF3187 family protein [SAR324 cluster bacterium]|jgi:hypothetical protein|nr:DUF3187 family protein [SAR324 cluster bacterium]